MFNNLVLRSFETHAFHDCWTIVLLLSFYDRWALVFNGLVLPWFNYRSQLSLLTIVDRSLPTIPLDDRWSFVITGPIYDRWEFVPNDPFSRSLINTFIRIPFCERWPRYKKFPFLESLDQWFELSLLTIVQRPPVYIVDRLFPTIHFEDRWLFVLTNSICNRWPFIPNDPVLRSLNNTYTFNGLTLPSLNKLLYYLFYSRWINGFNVPCSKSFSDHRFWLFQRSDFNMLEPSFSMISFCACWKMVFKDPVIRLFLK